MMSHDELLRECSMAFEAQFGEEFTGASRVKNPNSRSYLTGMNEMYKLAKLELEKKRKVLQALIDFYGDQEQEEREQYLASMPMDEEEKVF